MQWCKMKIYGLNEDGKTLMAVYTVAGIPEENSAKKLAEVIDEEGEFDDYEIEIEVEE